MDDFTALSFPDMHIVLVKMEEKLITAMKASGLFLPKGF